jgi:predicted tellurium resistance membrane protein TerC
MSYRIAADLVLMTHFAFIVLVVAGGLVVFRYAWFAWIHIPAASWGAFIELTGRICPLTTLENFLRIRAGILPVIYPAGLTRHVQLVLAGLVVAVNVIIYAAVLLHKRKARQREIRT